ncbi:trypsin-like peptidase domain-containing protein [Streptomyces sp. TRM 70351]|nr:trypsin-like peptidase domain-containing protein [Streptomyces sp. TRM 70351]MEE1927719.1 trypsin-like peptidase domain-containing protein [Streptomyces sp. TRM 70351]
MEDAAEGAGTKPTWWSRPRPAPAAGTPRPAPLHGEDPYATPPYGDLGPWSPAPPVQRPRPTAPVPPPPGAPPAAAAPAPAPSAPAPGSPAPAAAARGGAGWRGYDPWAGPPARPAPEARPEAGRPRRRRLVSGAVLLALLAGGAGGVFGAYLERTGGLGTVTLPQAPPESAERPADSVAGIAAATLPGVVTLHVRGAGSQGTGTGFVLDERGHILTNHHVVSPAEEGGRIQVTFSSGETAGARLIGGDSGYDLAVVKVDGVSGLRPLPLGDSDTVQVGDPVVAIGAPFDLAGTVTSGIISAKERPITAGGERGASDIAYVDALQTDAPINPGNSGGPLVDARGRVIGVNSAIRSVEGTPGGDAQGGSIGLGFAIPINQGKRVAEELINTGRATHPVIGVSVDMSYTGEGALVGVPDGDRPAVVPGGPADQAGIEDGDVITAVDDALVRTGEELIVKIRSHRPGDALALTVRRAEEELTVTVTLGTASGG